MYRDFYSFINVCAKAKTVFLMGKITRRLSRRQHYYNCPKRKVDRKTSGLNVGVRSENTTIACSAPRALYALVVTRLNDFQKKKKKRDYHRRPGDPPTVNVDFKATSPRDDATLLNQSTTHNAHTTEILIVAVIGHTLNALYECTTYARISTKVLKFKMRSRTFKKKK